MRSGIGGAGEPDGSVCDGGCGSDAGNPDRAGPARSRDDQHRSEPKCGDYCGSGARGHLCNVAIEEVVHPGPGHFRTFRDFAIFTHVADEEVEEEPYGCGQKQLWRKA